MATLQHSQTVLSEPETQARCSPNHNLRFIKMLRVLMPLYQQRVI